MLINRLWGGILGFVVAIVICGAPRAAGNEGEGVIAEKTAFTKATTDRTEERKSREEEEENEAESRVESSDEEDENQDDTMRATLDSVVVVTSATGFEQNIIDAPASISVITREELQERPFNNLYDALRDVPGIFFTGADGNEKDITIRGLPSDYTLIMVDGKRQGTRGTRPNGSGGIEAQFIPPAAAIERIEVIRDPMSSLYGSDAVGGIINIITRKDTKEWHGTAGIDYTVQQHDDSGNIFNTNFYLGGPIFTEKVGLSVWGSGHHRTEDQISNGYNGELNKTMGGRLLLRPFENHEFSLEGGRME